MQYTTYFLKLICLNDEFRFQHGTKSKSKSISSYTYLSRAEIKSEENKRVECVYRYEDDVVRTCKNARIRWSNRTYVRTTWYVLSVSTPALVRIVFLANKLVYLYVRAVMKKFSRVLQRRCCSVLAFHSHGCGTYYYHLFYPWQKSYPASLAVCEQNNVQSAAIYERTTAVRV